MLKLDALKTLLTRVVPSIRENPDTLSVFADRGRISARAGSLRFEYRYTATLAVQDYTGSLDIIIVPILGWIADNQPELMQKADSEPFGFEAELLADDLQDVTVTVELSERVLVKRVEGGTRTQHLPDRLPPDVFPGVEGVRLWQGIADELRTETTPT